MKISPNLDKVSAHTPVSCGDQRGMTLLETVIALLVMMIGVMGVMGVLAIAVTQNWAQGNVTSRTTEYAQDKMEQLMALNFTDGVSNTAVYPTTSTGGTGLGGAMAGNTTAGGVVDESPVTNYVDYINADGNQQSTRYGASYVRQWRVSTNATGTLKTVTVFVKALNVSPNGTAAPTTTLVSMKSQ